MRWSSSAKPAARRLSAVRKRAATRIEFDRFLGGLSMRRQQIGNPAAYQRLLDRLAQGEARAFDEVAEALHAHRLAEAVQGGKEAAFGFAGSAKGAGLPCVRRWPENCGWWTTSSRPRMSSAGPWPG